MHSRLTAALAVAQLTLALTACSGGDNPKPPPFTPSVMPSVTTTTPQTSAGDAAVAAYRRYIEVTDTLARSGGTDTRDLASVADGVELAASKIQAENYRGRKVKSTGTTEVRWAKVTKLGEPAAGKVTTASVQACIDTSKTDFVDAAGKSVRRPGTPTRWLDTRDLKFVDSRWKVVHGKNRAAKC